MISKAYNNYPRFVFQKDEKSLWNPILKKAFKNRPEERVRLQLIEYLTGEADFPKSRISFETPVKLAKDKGTSRTDIICYDEDFKPLLLVECKAPEIHLSEKTARQIGRYNREIEAPYLLISNGKKDVWFEVTPGSVSQLCFTPKPFVNKREHIKNFGYWNERGFIGSKSDPETRSWLVKTSSFLYDSDNPENIKFLNFNHTPPVLALANYYRVFHINDKTRLAIALGSTPFGSTNLNVVLNVEGINTALLSTSLNLIEQGEKANTVLQTAKGTKQIDLIEKTGFSFSVPFLKFEPALSEYLQRFS